MNGNVTFCPHFKYLGSWIYFSLRDDHDVAKRIASADASMGAMSDFWDDDHVNVHSKYLIFHTIPCNLLLWGCESWDLRQTLLDARSETKLLFVNSLTSGKLSEEKVLTFPHSSSQHGATILAHTHMT